jgi:hypothetical protein
MEIETIPSSLRNPFLPTTLHRRCVLFAFKLYVSSIMCIFNLHLLSFSQHCGYDIHSCSHIICAISLGQGQQSIFISVEKSWALWYLPVTTAIG